MKRIFTMLVIMLFAASFCFAEETAKPAAKEAPKVAEMSADTVKKDETTPTKKGKRGKKGRKKSTVNTRKARKVQ